MTHDLNYKFGFWWKILKTVSNMVALLCLLDFVYDFHLEENKTIKKVGTMVDRCKFIDVTIDEGGIKAFLWRAKARLLKRR